MADDEPTEEELEAAMEGAAADFASAMPPVGAPLMAARVTDNHICPMVNGIVPHVGGPILPVGCPTVLIGKMPAARMGDMLTCVGPPDVIMKGSPTVFIGGMMAARMLDTTAHGGMIVTGFPTVIIGNGAAGGSSSPSGGQGLGAAAGGGAATDGSSSNKKSNGPFDSMDDAARAALDEANPKSIKDNLEYSGLIYQGPDDKYYYTGPAQGSDQGANPYGDAPAPENSTVVGDYHTHGDYSIGKPSPTNPGEIIAERTSDPARDDFGSDSFSSTDRDDNDARSNVGYLGTPGGAYLKYDGATGADPVQI